MKQPQQNDEVQFAIPSIQIPGLSQSQYHTDRDGLAGSFIDSGASLDNGRNPYLDRAQAVFHNQQQYPEYDMLSNNFRDAPTNTDVMDGDKYVYHQSLNGELYNPYTKQSGSKATRNFNPGNITGMNGKLLYGAHKIARSNHGDVGDQSQLVFGSARDGWRAMHSLMRSDKYNKAGIAQDFAKWQSDKAAWSNMLSKMQSSGIDTNMTFNSLPMNQKIEFMRMRAAHEGYKGQDLTFDMLS
jgi:hypothetical protein